MSLAAYQPDNHNTRGRVCWAFYDWGNSSFAAVIQTFVFAAYFTRQVAADESIGTAQWGNTIGFAGLAVALGGPILGAIADHTGRRKPWIVTFTLLCVAATGLLWFVTPEHSSVALAVLLVALGTIGSEFANIFYNAMLPGLTRSDTLGRWSGWGWSLGYVGGLLCLTISLFVFIRSGQAWFGLDPESAEPVRATFPFVAAWYLTFALPLILFTPDTPSSGKSFRVAARAGLRQLADSVRHVRRYRHIMIFLVARMFYIDGLTTVFTFGGVYAAGTFDMTEQQVLVFGIALNITAGLGAAAFAWIDDWIGGKRTILYSVAGLTVASTLILLVTSQTAFWVFGLLLGIFVGPAQAASRSFLARLAPETLRNEMFGLLAFSGKATAFLGPILVGWVTYATGSQRLGMATIVGFFIIGFALMLRVPAQPKNRS